MIYVYQCKECKHTWEHSQKLNDPKPICPNCKTKEPNKLPTISNFILKGKGWCKDGYTK